MKSTIQKGMKSKVYNGMNTLFWRDIWLEDFPLHDLTRKDISLEESYKTMEMYWSCSTSNYTLIVLLQFCSIRKVKFGFSRI